MIQFISQGRTNEEHLHSIDQALQGGCQWIQLRMKDVSDDVIVSVAQQAKVLCEQYNATFILNDQPHLVLQAKASGVHLGKNDMTPSKARKLLGEEYIIGGTANNWDDIVRLVNEGVDYIGLGPFRFTTTKANLSPVIGIEGYQVLLKKVKEAGYQLPIVAIGGISLEDLPALFNAGVRGVAISGCVAQANNPIETMKQFNKQIKIWTN